MKTEQQLIAEMLELLSSELTRLLREAQGGCKIVIHISPRWDEIKIEPPPPPPLTVRRQK